MMTCLVRLSAWHDNVVGMMTWLVRYRGWLDYVVGTISTRLRPTQRPPLLQGSGEIAEWGHEFDRMGFRTLSRVVSRWMANSTLFTVEIFTYSYFMV